MATTSGGLGPLQLLEEGQNEAAFAPAVSAEEIQRYTVAEGLGDVERAQLYLAGCQPVQQLAVLANLPGLLCSAGRGAWVAISRPLTELASQLDSEGQLMAAEAFTAVARQRLLLPCDLADAVLPLVLAGVGDGSTAAVQQAWLACLGDVAAALEPGTLHSRVLPAVVQRGAGGGRGPRERCLCCQLLGAVVPHAAAEDLRGTLLRLGAGLCADTEWQVRHTACQQVPALARAAADRLDAAALGGVLSDLFALLEDEEALVRAAAWRSLAAVLDLLPPELRRSRALPLLLHQCRDTDPHAEVHRSLTAGLGQLLCALVPDMQGDAEVAACLTCYRGMAWRHDHATRLNCAAAFAAVLRAATGRRYGAHLHDTLLRLAADADVEVRLAVARALPDVAAALGPDRCCQYMRQPLAGLLQDERQEVQLAVAERLPELLACFASPLGPATAAAVAASPAAAAAAEEQRGRTFGAFVEPLLRAEAGSGRGWRLQLALLQAFPALAALLPQDPLHDRFFPLALKYLAEGPAALRDAAAAAAVAIWRALRRPAQRTALYGRLVRDFGQARSSRHRMAFLDVCRHALQRFSSKFVKAHLLEPALALAFDPVPNVRLHLAAAMPALKGVLGLPDDVHLLEALNSGMSRLATDADTDVCAAARRTNEEFKRLPVRMSCGALEGSPPEVKALEAADAARAEAERGLAFEPEALERIRADIAAYGERLRPPEARLALVLPPAARADREGSGSGASSRLGSSRGSSGRGAAPGPRGLARALVAATAAAAGVGHQRSTSDGAGQPRGKGPSVGLEGRSASVDGQQQPSSATRSLQAAGRRAPGRLKAAAAAARVHCKVELPSPAGAGPAAAEAPPPSAPQKQAQRLQGLGGDAAPRLSRPSPGAAARAAAAAPRLGRPSLGGASPQPAKGLASPVEATLPAALAGVAETAGQGSAREHTRHAAAAPAPLAGAAAEAGRRASLRSAASRAAAEVQQLASKLKAALLSPPDPPQPPAAAGGGAAGQHVAAARGQARPARGSFLTAKTHAAPGSPVNIRLAADATAGHGTPSSRLAGSRRGSTQTPSKT